MVLDFLRDNLNGDSWEKWCDACYRDRYQQQNYLKIPAEYLGDAGIEGFTQSGIAYQCYCPEKAYTNDELYEHLRDKASKDIGKLIDAKNAKRLKDLGVPVIREWHFVIPEYRDKRIIEHLETKRLEVVAVAESDPVTFYYISPDIRLLPKVAEDFKVEFARLIRNPLVDIKINAAVKTIANVDWKECSTDKINNIKRKLLAIMNTDESDDCFQEMLEYWAQAYLKGIEIMRNLQETCGSLYEELFELEQQYKKDVYMRSRMNDDHSLNNSLFQGILDEFEKTIQKQFSCFSEASIKELRRDLVSGWLADCSLQFKAV